jgi:hypothetical protein
MKSDHFFFAFIGLSQQINSQLSTQPHALSTDMTRPHTLQTYLSPFVNAFFFFVIFAAGFFAVVFFVAVFFATVFFVAIVVISLSDSEINIFHYIKNIFKCTH